MMTPRQYLALGGVAALLYMLYRRSQDAPLASSPLTLSNGAPLPQIGWPHLPVYIDSRLSSLSPFRDASDPNYAALAAAQQGTPTYAGYNAPGSHTWGVPMLPAVQSPSVEFAMGLPDVSPENADLIAQYRAEDAAGPSVSPDPDLTAIPDLALYALDLL